MSFMNRIGNCTNPYQGHSKKVLCVCSAGLLRSPTAAKVLGQSPYNFNTRAAGLSEEYALIRVDDVLLTWADEIVCMEPHQKAELQGCLKSLNLNTPVVCLQIKDSFVYNDPILVELIRERYNVT